jgi:flagellin
MFANRQLGVTQGEVAKSMEKLASGLQINRAGDDASGLAVSEKMRSQIRGLNQAERNIQNGVSFIQTAEGYLQEVQDIIGRTRELAVQSANGIYLEEDRKQIQVEVDQLVDEINRISEQAQFNGKNILDGTYAADAQGTGAVGQGGPMRLQVGANMDQFKEISIGDMSATTLGLAGLSLESVESANAALGTLDEASKQVSAQRADLGAFQNRFETAAKGIAVASENLQAAESRIRDADMAQEMVKYTKDQILSQAGTAMLAQANVRTQSVLQLLG